MKIAQIAPLMEAVPPRLYGGTERVVSYLTEELVRLGHEVTLFGSGDSDTSAELVACCPRALRLDSPSQNPVAHNLLMLEQVRRRSGEFELIHFHLELIHVPIFRAIAERTVTTLHGRLDSPELYHFYREFSEFPLVAVSGDQRSHMPAANWVGTVYHGLPPKPLRFSASGGDGYLAFLGRIAPEKRVDRAIEIAQRAGLTIRIAAKVDDVDRDYFERRIRPLLNHPSVEFLGEISEADKSDFLGNARALLLPIDWPEPFGIVSIEAMACGTPVIAFRMGAAPEVVEDGVTGFLVDTLDTAVNAVERLGELDRVLIRRRFEQRFSIERVAGDYLTIYETLIGGAGRRRFLKSSEAR